MKNYERIIKYIDRDLTQEEKVAFENDLNNSPELLNEYMKYLRVKEETDLVKRTELNPLYLNSIITEFRSDKESRSKIKIMKNLRYAFGIMLVFVISIVFLKYYFNSQDVLTEEEKFAQSLDENQKIELLENLNGDREIYDIVTENIAEPDLVSLFGSNLKVNDDVAKAYNIEYNDIVPELSEDEVELIYKEILSTEF